MNDNREHLWQAYLDGELSVTEMAEFEQSLTPEDQNRLTAEKRFESGLAERLAEDAACPDDVWERTKAILAQAQALENDTVTRFPAGSIRRRSWMWGAATLTAAACVAFILTIFSPSGTSDTSPVVILAAETVDELAKQSETDHDAESVHQFINEHGYDLDLNREDSLGMAAVHYGIEVVGAREETIKGDPVVEMLFGCCEYPVKVIMAKRDSSAARYIGQAAGAGSDIQATRIINDKYIAAVVGKHPAHGLLDIFANQHP